MAIDVGTACVNRDTTFLITYTVVGAENPANADGTIDYVCVYNYGVGTSGVEVASVVDEGSNVLSTNGTATLPNRAGGQQEYNAPGDFTAFNINTGEYIGIHGTDGNIERVNAGSGYWYKSGDYIPTSSETFIFSANRTVSLYATGTEAAPPVGAIMNQFQGANLGADLFNGPLL